MEIKSILEISQMVYFKVMGSLLSEMISMLANLKMD